ncbi:hypothetical protein ACRALDRAFT_205820 [Sodiomyces alcalophilus JCM 7366]|uniref:uncharacterized protein n=1 Tax=Sodiomyces alcalophilus JCM 7366 TaxID=591952 RepID=UPI0039B414F3
MRRLGSWEAVGNHEVPTVLLTENGRCTPHSPAPQILPLTGSSRLPPTPSRPTEATDKSSEKDLTLSSSPQEQRQRRKRTQNHLLANTTRILHILTPTAI